MCGVCFVGAGFSVNRTEGPYHVVGHKGKHRINAVATPCVGSGVPFSAWPPATVGGVKMTTQFADSATGDVKLFVDFSNPEDFDTKLWNELVPRLHKHADVPLRPASTMWGRAAKVPECTLPYALPHQGTLRCRTCGRSLAEN